MKRNRRTGAEMTFDIINVLFMLIICFVLLYPIWYTVVHSFNDATDAMMGHLYWWPRKFSLDSYKAVFKSNEIFTAFGITAARTLIGTLASVFFTAMVAYGLSKTELIGRKFFMSMGIVTMFFSGGLIPTFLLIKNLNLLDNFLVYILPALFSFYNLIIFQSFFRELPKELEESAKVDGANDFLIFIKIILPLSKAVLATIALFNGVYHWNEYFSGVIYINNTDLQPIQTYLYRIVAEASSSEMMANMPGGVRSSTISSQSIKLATMVVTTFPIVCIYPFLQKYFVKGMLLGSVKG